MLWANDVQETITCTNALTILKQDIFDKTIVASGDAVENFLRFCSSCNFSTHWLQLRELHEW